MEQQDVYTVTRTVLVNFVTCVRTFLAGIGLFIAAEAQQRAEGCP